MNEQKLALEPCHKCGEHDIDAEGLATELHPGVAYVICEACKHRGPEIFPRGDMRLREDRAKVLKAVIEAWNAEQRLHRPEPAEKRGRLDPAI